jgi:hypothetical protein
VTEREGVRKQLLQKKYRFPQESSYLVAYFSVFKNVVLNHHIHHAKHHKFTTKNHPLHTTFSKTTLKNARKTAKPRSNSTRSGVQLFFCKKAAS